MSINYSRINWDTTKFINPTNMNQMDKGIEDAVDEINRVTKGQTIADNTDMNTITTAGVYQASTATTLTLRNIPVSNAFICEVFVSGTRILQRVTRVTDATTCYQRVYSSSAWSEWERIITSVQSGYVDCNIPSGSASSQEYTVTFDKAFNHTPIIILTGASQTTSNSNVPIPVITDRKAGYFKFKVWRNDTSSQGNASPAVCWVAF